MSDSYSIDCLAGVPLESSQAGASPPAGERVASATSGSSATTGRDAESFHFDGRDSAYRQRSFFESAESNRLNEGHWARARIEAPANDDLELQLPTMRMRAGYEKTNNPTLDGLMLSHTIAVAGGPGPLLDLEGEDDATDEWCEEAERVWEEWCEVADAGGQMTLCALVKQWNISCWRNGSFFEQLVTEEREFWTPGVPTLRLHGVEPQRVLTPPESAGDPDVRLGIRRNRYQRPLEYYVSNHYGELGRLGRSGGQWIPAADMLHGFDLVQAERGQAQGEPWCAVGLPLSADARDYDLQVLDAARSAADLNVIAYTEHPDADFVDNVPASVEYRRRRINHLAPGWKAAQPTPAHPGANYTDHRKELQGDVGKGKAIPGAVARLDGREHNYSSLRWDYRMLGESAEHVRSTLYDPRLRRLARLVLSEAQLAGRLRRPPGRFHLVFVWPPLPEIDELKSASSEELYLRLGTLSYSEACSRRHGRRARDQMRRRARDDRMLRRLGLPTVDEAARSRTNSGTNSSSDDGAVASANADASNGNEDAPENDSGENAAESAGQAAEGA